MECLLAVPPYIPSNPLPADPDHLAPALIHLCARPRNKYPKHQQQPNHRDQPTNPPINPKPSPSQQTHQTSVHDSTARIQEVEIDHSQRLQTLDADPASEGASEEGEECGAGLAETRDPADRTREKPWGQHTPSVVHDDREDWPEEEADEGHADRARK